MSAFRAGIAQLVEHNLAKVGVASSSLVSRSNIPKTPVKYLAGVFSYMQCLLVAGWQSGYAAACKAVDGGSIPPSASIYQPLVSAEASLGAT